MALASTSEHSRKPRVTGRQRREWTTGYLFILPATLLIAIFGLFPIIYAIYMSVHNWRIRKGAFIGLTNYTNTLGDWWGALAFFGGLLLIIVAHWLWTEAFKGDQQGAPAIAKAFGALVLIGSGISISLGWGLMMEAGNRTYLNGLVRTVYYGFGSVPIQIALALMLASLLFQKIR